jgi:lactoylglutathione lyase
MDYDRDDTGTMEVSYRLETRARRVLHTMLRVSDLQRSLDFYIGLLGMRLLRRQDYPAGRFTLAFVGYDEESAATALELTHNWDQDAPYQHGTFFGHIALAVDDLYSCCSALAEKGVTIARPPGPMKYSPTLIAFIEDPDGYRIELIEVRS